MAKARILVLEDDDSFRQFLCEALSLAGYEAAPAENGPVAIAEATRQKFDLAICDVRMAGMDGLDCLTSLRSIQPGMRSIVITGYASEEAPARAIAAETEDYLYKPFGLAQFVGAVSRVLESGRERSMYSAVLDTYRRLVGPSNDERLESLDKRRDLAFQSLFVGIRSRKLSESEALRLWDHLETHDRQRERFKEEGMPKAQMQALLQGYQFAIDLAGAMSRSHMYVPRQRADGCVSEAVFEKLFLRVKAGEVSVEQLKLAPFLRSLDPRVFQASAQLSELFAKVWGQPP